jgi:excinuclease UvrABC ATPase subunit
MADHVVDMGPGAGEKGGRVLYEGPLAQFLETDTATARDMRETVPVNATPRAPKGWLSVKTEGYHNLGEQTIEVPTGVLTVFCGVAGSGKTSLGDVAQRYFETEVVAISQKNIGISLRSTPATYLGAGDEIRRLFARENRVSEACFSFNSKGACPACKGKGVIVTDMSFMEDIVTVCEACNGMRYAPEVLGYLYRGKNVAAVMDMTVAEAQEFFADMPFAPQLRRMERVGLDYLRLNQSLSTLSGGELQRLKLASSLDRKGGVYILDEPTSGLHMDDVKKLLRLFDELVDEGNTVIVMEHNLAVVKHADWLIELGPDGGDKGGRVLFSGPPAMMKDAQDSVTARYL